MPFLIFKSPFCSCEPSCKILKAKFCKFSLQVVKIFATAKHPLGTRVPFCILKTQFCCCEISCELGCEITFKLRNGLKLRKCQSSFKGLFKPLFFSIFVSHSHFNLRKSSSSCEIQELERTLSKRSLEHVRLKKTTPRTSAYPLEHEPLHFSHGQDERSPNPVSISSQHQTENFTCTRLHV